MNMRHFFLAIVCCLPLFACQPKPGETPPEWERDPVAEQAVQEGDFETAIRRYEALLEKQPDNALAHYHLGYALGMAGEHMGEIEHYRKAEALGYGDAAFHYNLGMAYGEAGMLDAALDAFARAVKLDPDDAEYRFGLGAALENMGRAEEAQVAFAKAVELAPDHLDARWGLVRMMVEQGKLAEARREVELILERNPEDPLARQLLREIDSAMQ